MNAPRSPMQEQQQVFLIVVPSLPDPQLCV